MGPIDYASQVGQPFEAAIGGYQAGAMIRDDRLKQQQQAAAMAQQEQQRQIIGALINNPNPTADDFSRATLAVPGMREQFEQAHKMRGAEQAKSDMGHVSQVYAALQQGQPDIAIRLMKDRSSALRNSGREEDAKHLDVMAGVAEQSPSMARSMAGLYLASVPGGDKLLDGIAKLGAESRADAKAPAELRAAEADATTKEAGAAVAPVVAQAGADKAVSEAKTAGVAAKYAEPQALLDIEKKGWDITALKADIDYKREANRIAAMNAAASRESNSLKREELQLKIDEARQKVADKVRERVAETESGAATIDNMLNTIERLKQNPSLNDVLGSVEGRLPSVLSDEGADAIGLIDTIGSQAFLSQLPAMKGAGALSDAEGKKLQAALTNLTRTQSESQFRANLTEAGRLMLKARTNLSKRTGVPLQWPDTPAAAATPAPARTGSGVTVSGW